MGSNPRSCRICLDAKLEDLVAFQTDSDWAHLFEFCTGLSVTKSNAPQYFCLCCSEKLREFSNFKNKCLKSDVLWQKIWKSSKNEPGQSISKPVIEYLADDDDLHHSHFDDGTECGDSFTDTKPYEFEEKSNQALELVDYLDFELFEDTNRSENKVTDFKSSNQQKKETKQPVAGSRKSTRTIKPPVKFTVSNESPQVQSIDYIMTSIHSTIGKTDNTTVKPVKIMNYLDVKKEKIVKIKHKNQIQKMGSTNKVKIINLNNTRKRTTLPPVVKITDKVLLEKPAAVKKLVKNINDPKIPKVKITAQNLESGPNSKVIKQATISYVDVSDINPQVKESLPRLQKSNANTGFQKVKIVSYLNEDEEAEKAQTKSSKQSNNEVFFSEDAQVDENDSRDSDYDPKDDKKYNNDSDYDPRDDQYTHTRPNKPADYPGGTKVKVVKLDTGKKLPIDIKFYCGICKFGPTDSEAMKQHWNMHTVKGNLNCRLCPYIGRDMADMAAHRYVHIPPDYKTMHICLVCLKKNWDVKNLEFHYRTVHLNKKGGICKFCGFEAASFYSWKRHEKGHTHPWICDHCGKNFWSRGRMKDHWVTVLAKKKNICEYCGQGFKRKKDLKNHIQSRHVDSKLKCHHCDKTFRTEGILKGHLRSLSGPQHFCETCGKGFMSLYILKAHIYMHTNERPHICDRCQKTFRWKQNLQHHILSIHVGVKSHICEVCFKAFSLKRELKRHMSMHTGIRPVKCLYDQCDKTFYDGKTMKAHCKSKHEGRLWISHEDKYENEGSYNMPSLVDDNIDNDLSGT